MLSLPIASTSTITFARRPQFSNPTSSFYGVKIQQRCTIRLPPQTLSSRNPPSSIVMMAKREEELKDIRTKTTEEINEEVVDLQGELLMLRLQKSARNEFKSSEFRRMRKRVLSLRFCFNSSQLRLNFRFCILVYSHFGTPPLPRRGGNEPLFRRSIRVVSWKLEVFSDEQVAYLEEIRRELVI